MASSIGATAKMRCDKGHRSALSIELVVMKLREGVTTAQGIAHAPVLIGQSEK
jgi:hypothetical protein